MFLVYDSLDNLHVVPQVVTVWKFCYLAV